MNTKTQYQAFTRVIILGLSLVALLLTSIIGVTLTYAQSSSVGTESAGSFSSASDTFLPTTPGPKESQSGVTASEGPNFPDEPEMSPDLIAETQSIAQPEYDYSIKDIYLKVRTYTSNDGINWARQADPEFDTWKKMSCGDQSPFGGFQFKGVNDNWDALSNRSYLQAMKDAEESPYVYALASIRFTNRVCDQIFESATGRTKNYGCENAPQFYLFPRGFESSKTFTTYNNPDEGINQCLGFNSTDYNTIDYNDNIGYLSLDRYIYEFPEDQREQLSQKYKTALGDGLVHSGIEMVYPQYTHLDFIESCNPTNDNLSGISEICDLAPNPGQYIEWTNPNRDNIMGGWLVYPLQGDLGKILAKPVFNDESNPTKMTWSLDSQVLFLLEDDVDGDELLVYSPYGDEFRIPEDEITRIESDFNGDSVPESQYQYNDGNGFSFDLVYANDKIAAIISFEKNQSPSYFNINNYYFESEQEFGYLLDAEMSSVYPPQPL